jgi:hypothetical protein
VDLELWLSATERRQRRDRDELSLTQVEGRPPVDLPVGELDHVAAEVGGDVLEVLDDPLAAFCVDLSEAFPSASKPFALFRAHLDSSLALAHI